MIAAGNDALFAALCAALGRAGARRRRALRDERRRACATSTRSSAELEAALARAARADWLARLEAAGIPCGPIQDVAQVLADPQVAARNMLIRAGTSAMAGNPIKLAGFPDPAGAPPRARPRPAPHRPPRGAGL